jgi:hypothetical protein
MNDRVDLAFKGVSDMKLVVAIAALTVIGAASLANAQSAAPSANDRAGSALAPASALPQQDSRKETTRSLQSKLEAAKPGQASAKAAPPQPVAFGSK